MIGDVSSLNAKMEMSELRGRVPPDTVRVLMGLMMDGQPQVSLFGDFPDPDEAAEKVRHLGPAGAIFQGYNHSGELVLEL